MESFSFISAPGKKRLQPLNHKYTEMSSERNYVNQ